MAISSTSSQKHEPPNTNKTATKKQFLFILSGQSNMSGRGGVEHNKWDGVVPDDCKPDPSTIHRLNAKLIWETAQEPLHADIDIGSTCGIGPGMAFANAVKGSIDGVIDLIPCAIGGTAIKEWGKGQKLYNDMVTRAKSGASSGGEIKAMLWYQGESDTTSKQDAESYKSNMENLINNLRSDLGLPSMPIIQVAIASANGDYIEVVRRAQKAIDLPNVVCVDAKGLQLKEDNRHLATEAQVQLGHMLADAFLAHFV